MKPVTIKSIFDKTLKFENYLSDSSKGQIKVECRDDNGVCKLSMVFNRDQVDALREALRQCDEKPSVSVSTVGEMSRIEVTGGSVVINAAGGTVIVNNK